MVSLSNTTGYGVRALTCLAGCRNPPASIKTLAERSGVPQAYLAKIVKTLNDAGIIESKRGSGGGIWLARPSRLISLLEICTALEGEELFGACLFGLEPCSDNCGCPAHKFWVKYRELMRRELNQIKLSDVLEFDKDTGMDQMLRR
jgi:Rrf2 family iron-sulfur cluster assembly transcriptional regulator